MGLAQSTNSDVVFYTILEALMATFAETAIVAYHLSFAYQGKQTCLFCFRFAENKRKFAISFFLLQQTYRTRYFLLGTVYIGIQYKFCNYRCHSK